MTARRQSLGIAAGLVLVLAALWTWRAVERVETIETPGAGIARAPTEVAPLTRSGTEDAASTPERAPAPVADSGAPARLASEDARFGSLRLHVVWAEDQSPAAGVWMRLFQSGGDDPYRTTCDARTDANGDARVERVHAGAVQIKLDRGAHANVRVQAGEDRSETISIPAGFSIAGSVVDHDGSPFAGAEIYVQIFGYSHEGFVVGRSASDGSFGVRSLSARTRVAISALAPGRTPTKQHLVTAERGETARIRLAFEAPGGACAGRVLAPDGAPVAGARVLIGEEGEYRPVPLADGSFGQPPAARSATTDEGGHFAIDGLAPGAQPVQARATGFAPWNGEVAIHEGLTSPLEVRLLPGASLRGVARDESGAGLGDVFIWVGNDLSLSGMSRLTRKDGSFDMQDLPLGEFTVEAGDDQRGTVRTTMVGAPGAELRWDPVLSTGAKLRVRLVAPGSELAGWRITVEQRPNALEGDNYADTRTTDREGLVEFVNVPDVSLRISLRAPGAHAFPRAVLEGVRARDGDVVIQPDPALEPTVFLRGRCLDPEGKPLGGVRLAPVNPELFYPPFTVSDPATGEFAFGPLPAGTWSVHALAPGLARLRTPSVRVDSGMRWDFGDLQLERGGTVVAELIAPEGASSELASVVLRDAAGAIDELVVEGTLAHSSLVPAGRYTLIASGVGLTASETSVDVRAGEETRVVVELKRP